MGRVGKRRRTRSVERFAVRAERKRSRFVARAVVRAVRKRRNCPALAGSARARTFIMLEGRGRLIEQPQAERWSQGPKPAL